MQSFAISQRTATYGLDDDAELLAGALAVTTSNYRSVHFNKLIILQKCALSLCGFPKKNITGGGTLKKRRIAVAASSRIRSAAPKVFVRGRRWATSRRNS